MRLCPSCSELVSEYFSPYYNFYDIEHCDPKEMLKPPSIFTYINIRHKKQNKQGYIVKPHQKHRSPIKTHR